MTDTRSFIAGVLTTTILTVLTFIIAGHFATNSKREACNKFAAITGEQTQFVTYGLGESKCFAGINGQWLDVNP